MVTLIKT